MKKQTKNIFLALDFDNVKDAFKTADQVKNYIAGIKIGLELWNASGIEGLKKLEELNLPIFLDTKIFDVPNQVYKSIKVLKNFKKINYLTIHGLGSKEMLLAAKKAINEINPNIKLLAVTILTSMNQNDLELIGIKNDINEQVKIIAKLALDNGADGLVASGLNLKMIKKEFGKDTIIFCPAIREKSHDDQKRFISYSEFCNSADENCYAVIGRPITVGNPKKNIEQILNLSN